MATTATGPGDPHRRILDQIRKGMEAAAPKLPPLDVGGMAKFDAAAMTPLVGTRNLDVLRHAGVLAATSPTAKFAASVADRGLGGKTLDLARSVTSLYDGGPAAKVAASVIGFGSGGKTLDALLSVAGIGPGNSKMEAMLSAAGVGPRSKELEALLSMAGTAWERPYPGYDSTAYRNALDAVLGPRSARVVRDVVAWTESPDFEPMAAAAALPIKEHPDAVRVALIRLCVYAQAYLSEKRLAALVAFIGVVWMLLDADDPRAVGTTVGGAAWAIKLADTAPKWPGLRPGQDG
jgi:hypothetical protein